MVIVLGCSESLELSEGAVSDEENEVLIVDEMSIFVQDRDRALSVVDFLVVDLVVQ